MILRLADRFFAQLVALLIVALLSPMLDAQENDEPLPFLPGSPRIHERVTSNIRFYENGRYLENLTRETRGQLSPDGAAVEGTFYVLESVIRGGQSLGGRVDAAVEVSLPLQATPGDWARVAALFPRIRPLPSLPEPLPRVGEVWEHFATVVFQPDLRGAALILPLRFAFRFDGEANFMGRRVYAATGSLRVNQNVSFAPPFSSLRGEHTISIVFDPATRAPLFIRDNVEEEYVLNSGTRITLRGFYLHFYEQSGPESPAQVADTLRGTIAERDLPNVRVEEDDSGVTLTMQALGFVADRATFLPGERERLTDIADLLKETAGRTILVVGHTADVGNPAGQQRLSEERALAVVEALIEEGVDPGRLIYEGRGGRDPVASNATEEGRSQNRRVEIRILR
jgi:outer membrane protein OmpA-like peptidoglycan-associated protein